MPRAPKRARRPRRRMAPTDLTLSIAERPVTLTSAENRCMECQLATVGSDLIDGRCGRCRKGKKPLTPQQKEWVAEQARMRASTRTAAQNRRLDAKGTLR